MAFPTPTVLAPIGAPSNVAGSSPALANGVVVYESGEFVRKTRFVLTSAVVTQTRTSSSIGNGGLQIYDFPKGGILILGASMKMAYLLASAAAISDANMIHSLGTVVASTANAALTSTEADWIPSTTAANGSGVGIATTPAILDGTGTAKDLYLNINTSSDITANRSVYATGWVEVTWINLGDTTL